MIAHRPQAFSDSATHTTRSLLLAGTVALVSAISASAVNIDVAISPAGPVAVGDEITVELSISGWNPADGGVDSIAFNVDFDTTAFTYVPASSTVLSDSTEFLALPSQGAGYALLDTSTEAAVAYGRYSFGAQDIGDASAGSLGPAGPLGSFRLTAATAMPAANITVQTNNPNQIFGDTNYLGIPPSDGVTLGSIAVEVYDPVTYATWRAGVPFAVNTDGEPEVDVEGDTKKNVVEYGIDTDPLVADTENLPAATVVNVGGKDYQAFTYVRPSGTAARSDLEYEGQRSTDLADWKEDEVVETVAAGPGANEETVTVRSSIPIDENTGREFLRLIVRFKGK